MNSFFMFLAILSIFALAFIAPLVHRWTGRFSGVLLAALPALLFAYFASAIPQIAAGEVLLESIPWMPGLELQLSFRLDGLSLLFALLITGIGIFIVSYAGSYLSGHRDLGRFYVLILHRYPHPGSPR